MNQILQVTETLRNGMEWFRTDFKVNFYPGSWWCLSLTPTNSRRMCLATQIQQLQRQAQGCLQPGVRKLREAHNGWLTIKNRTSDYRDCYCDHWVRKPASISMVLPKGPEMGLFLRSNSSHVTQLRQVRPYQRLSEWRRNSIAACYQKEKTRMKRVYYKLWVKPVEADF